MLRALGLSICFSIAFASAFADAQMIDEPFQFTVSGGADEASDSGIGYQGSFMDVRRIVPIRHASTTTGSKYRCLDGLNEGFFYGSPVGCPGFIPNPAASITAWTAIASGLPAPPPTWILRGHQPAPTYAWVLQVEALVRSGYRDSTP